MFDFAPRVFYTHGMNLDDDDADPFEALVMQLSAELARVGLHSQGAILMPAPDLSGLSEEEIDEFRIEDMSRDQIVGQLEAGTGTFAVGMRVLVGDLAFDERTLHPDRFSDSQMAASILPSKADMIQSYVQDQVASGVDMRDVKIPEHLLED